MPVQPITFYQTGSFAVGNRLPGLGERSVQSDPGRANSLNCYGVCPDNSVLKLGPGQRYEIDYDYRKGCGICAAECPCGAIEMRPEEQ